MTLLLKIFEDYYRIVVSATDKSLCLMNNSHNLSLYAVFFRLVIYLLFV